jgi:ribosome-binding ATPase YchF (GTP1/OBG family)
MNLLTVKPMIYVMNVDEKDLGSKSWDLGAGVKPEQVVAISAKIEAELADLDDQERGEYLKELGLTERGLDKLIKKGYEILNLITFLTSGPQESRAWTVTRGSTAPQAAGKIHTDFEKNFIRAEVCNWQDFVKYGEVGCKERGLIRIEGKEYVVQDGDTCYFRI